MANTNNSTQMYYINTAILHNRRLFSRQHIRAGDEIVAEAPLCRITIGLADTYNPDQVLEKLKKFNASRHLDLAREMLSEQDRDHQDRLFNKDPDGGICSLWSTNAFQIDEDKDGHTYTTLLLFNHISRANHSCRPNAFWQWDEKRGVATLHALEDIRTSCEIKIEYQGDAGFSFRTGTQRKKDLAKWYIFDCKCGACFVPGKEVDDHRNRKDDKLRSKALRLYAQIKSKGVPEDESAVDTALRKLKLAKEYIETLKEIGIKDAKLANAYRRLANYHEEAFTTYAPKAHRTNCGYCNGGRDKVVHLREALEVLNEEHRIRILCCGSEHPDLEEGIERRNEIQVKLNRHNR